MKFICSLCFLFAFGVFAQDYSKLSDPKTCKTALEKQHKSTQSIQADFTETTTSSLLTTAQKGSGKMWYKKEDKIRWEKIKPDSQVILINGNSVKLQEKGKEVSSASSKMVVKKIQQLMVQMMTGDFLNEKEFKITYYESKSNYKLVLVPKTDKMKKYVADISLIFSKENLLLKEMIMKQSDSDKLVYQFSNMQQNTTISDSKFTTF